MDAASSYEGTAQAGFDRIVGINAETGLGRVSREDGANIPAADCRSTPKQKRDTNEKAAHVE
jgi:hypothetical protein